MAGSAEHGFGKCTALIAGAGCEAGARLADAYARAGARVVAVDRDEAAVLEIARRHPDLIEGLGLDVMEAPLCARLGEVWEAEPLHVLILLQPLRHPRHPAAAMRSAEALTGALAAGLEAGSGSVAMICAGAPASEGAAAAAQFRAMGHLPALLQAAHAGRGVRVNGLRLPPGPPTAAGWEDLCAAAMALTRPGGIRAGGALVPLQARPD